MTITRKFRGHTLYKIEDFNSYLTGKALEYYAGSEITFWKDSDGLLYAFDNDQVSEYNFLENFNGLDDVQQMLSDWQDEINKDLEEI